MKFLRTMLGATMVSLCLAIPVTSSSPASAEPSWQIWHCWETRASAPYRNINTLQQCPAGQIRAMRTYTGDYFDGWDGRCANQKYNAGWSNARIKDACRLRDYGGPL